jgi:hypothetical protein
MKQVQRCVKTHSLFVPNPLLLELEQGWNLNTKQAVLKTQVALASSAPPPPNPNTRDQHIKQLFSPLTAAYRYETRSLLLVNKHQLQLHENKVVARSA